MVDRERRAQRRRVAARRQRWRLGASFVLALLLHGLAIPLIAGLFRFEGGDEPAQAPVGVVQIPAARWDQQMAQARDGTEAVPRQRQEAVPEAPPEEEEEPEQAPGQVVEVAPGNDEEAPDARFAAESSNRVDRETVARERHAGAPVTMPKPTVPEAPQQEMEAGPPSDRELALGEAAAGAPGEEQETIVEIPTAERRDALSLGKDPAAPGGIQEREGSDQVEGNAERLRVQVGGEAGEGGEAEAGEPPGGLKLFPSGAVVDRIVGGPAPDHVEGVEEGDGTFLNTREWKHASFFNRVKKSVSLTWDPNSVLRVRDPTGDMYAWKDRSTLLSVELRADGSLADIWVERSSGVAFLDEEAIAAFRRAEPFPHPPGALVNGEGLIQFNFGFHLSSQRPFRIFRRY